ncbi:hypothetical protein Goarm_006290 [Gossypium armourianum]|uniref:Uncharacterized protein n=1 Tax=Gossypium armourianum TaxID=34283 RepID=A0A7J9JI01_9ROSI|nr:hypothetical protein [Gossypium armourianum]
MRRQHPHTSRLRRLPLNLRAGEATPSSVPMQEPTLMVASPMPTPPTGQYVSSYSGAYSNPIIFTQASYVAPHFSTSSSMSAPTNSPLVIPLVYETQHSYAYSPFVTQTPPGSLFYQGGSSSQPPIPRPVDARCQPRMYRSQLTEGEDEELPRPQPHSEAEPRGNPARNCRPPNVAQILTNIWTD